ncbi:MAG: hypothetical protein G8D61_02275, partial [gamma proteobacterium symbiont of Ctena orbiculata]
ENDLVIITKGDRSGVEGQTNIMKVMRVGEHVLDDEQDGWVKPTQVLPEELK